MAFTLVDWAIIAIIAISTLISLKRGFVKEALSLLIWIIAGAVAWMFGGSLSVYLESYIQTPSMRVIAGCGILFVATLLVGAMLNFLIGELIRVTGLSGTDRFLGMVFGAARGGLLVVVALGLLSLGPVQQDTWWQESRLIPRFLLVADWSKNLVVGFTSQWMSGGAISTPSDLPFKEQLLGPTRP
ncbi:CvpA family protein [Pseudomonas fulva]|nr:CvpA family protein [Pseudomonas fulva]